jgi:carbamoyl-phosphate synthase large subunit
MSERVDVVLPFAGRKAYLCELLRGREGCGKIVALDADPLATVRLTADEFVLVPTVDQEEAYLRALGAVAERHAPAVVLPLNDMDLRLLARHSASLADRGLRVMGSTSEEVAAIVADKLTAVEWLGALGLEAPTTCELAVGSEYRALERQVVKARYGQGAEGLAFLEPGHSAPPSGIPRVRQPWLEGDEFHLDVLISGRGTLLALVAKRKLLMKWGSTDKAVSVLDAPFRGLGEALASSRAFVGSIDVDVVRTKSGSVVLDVNPRLGGGFPFTALLQPSYVDLLLAVGRGEEPAPRLGEYEAGVIGHRDFAYRLDRPRGR